MSEGFWRELAERGITNAVVIGIMGAVIWWLIRRAVEKLMDETKAMWEKIGDIEGRQMKLREEIPSLYVMKNDCTELHRDRTNALSRIETKLDQFMADCRTGKCLIRKIGGNP